jgi:vitamin B12 transporter
MAGAMAFAAPVHAQDEIVVTGRGLPDAAGDAAYSIVTIERARLNATASGRLEDALKDVAGLQQFRRSDARSANPTSQGATLRGLGGNAAARVLVLLDGVPQGDPFAGYLNWPLYFPERLGRVRVTRGGGSGAGGSGALAGTIELESVASGDAPGIAGSFAGGSFDSTDGRALLSGRLGSGFALVSGGYARGDGFVPVVSAGPADRGARYEQYSFAARAVVPVGTSEFQANVDAFDDARTRGTDFSANRTTGADASVRLVGGRSSRWAISSFAGLRRNSPASMPRGQSRRRRSTSTIRRRPASA